MFWALSQYCQLFWKLIWWSGSKLSEKVQKWHSDFSRPSVSWVIDWNMQNIVCIQYRRKLGEWRTTRNGEHLISSKSGKESVKIVYGNNYSFTRLWCVVIWEIYLNFVVKIFKKKKQNKTKQKKKTGKWLCLLFCTLTLIEQRMKIRSRADVKYSCK